MTATEAEDNASVAAGTGPFHPFGVMFFAGHHFKDGTFFSMRSLHDMSDILRHH